MGGLKAVWITVSALFLVASCVPQTKQTQCASNEAFNSTLRSCVPVIGGPTSFIKVNTFSPALPVSVYKNDSTIIPLSISVSNPYAQTYTVEWERVYNGHNSFYAGNTLTTSLIPLALSSEVGAHFLTAKIMAAGSVVDSHTFQINISDTPRPTIVSTSIVPPTYAVTLTPSDAAQPFSFTVNNNNSVVSGAGYNVKWTVTKNGAIQSGLSETDTFSNVATNGTNTFYLGTSVTPSFDPAVLGVGSYVIRATVANTTPGEQVGEQQWTVTVKHPDLSNIISRNLYTGSTTPSYNTVVNAYNGVPYTSSATYNFIPVGQTTQADFCVEVADGEGTYAGDGDFVRVDYYLDNVTLIYSGTTTAVDNKICLTDAPGATLNSVLFSNASATSTQTHQLVARLVDEATNTEYAQANLSSGLGTYPVAWNFSVKPLNAAPTVGFTAVSNLSGITCGAASGASRTCNVTQDAAFVVGVTATDEFYSTSSTTDSEQDKISYSMILYRNGSPISTCSKTTADVADTNTPGTDFVGPDYLCAFTVPSYDATGSVNPSLFSYSVSITVSDAGSPIVGAVGATSSTYTYALNVSEASTVPAVDPQGTSITDSYLAASTTPNTVIEDSSNAAHFITEGETLNVNVLVSDAERDDHQITVSLCTDFTVACTTSSLIASQTVLKTDNILSTTTRLSYTLPEDLIPITTPIGTNVATFLKVTVTDIPDILAPQTATAIFSFNARNKNPAPQFGGTPNPLLAASLTAIVGYPLTIDPGTVTDASVPGTESAIQYKWYVDADGGDNAYVAITGSTQRVLNWTPSSAIPSGTVINLVQCVSDGTVVNDYPASAAAVAAATSGNVNGSNCLGPWNVTVQSNALALQYAGSAANDLDPDVAVWQDTSVGGKRVVYSAYSDGVSIFIDKTVFTATGTTYNAASPGFETVSFTALSSGAAITANSIKDLSITGDADSLYVAYQAADDSNDIPRIRVRRIDKRTGVANGDKTNTSYPDTGKFGYQYAQTLPTAVGLITVGAPTAGSPYTVTFTGTLIAGDKVTLNGVDFNATVPEAAATLCAGAGCTNNGNAAKLALLINSSSNRDLQGLTATASGNIVTIRGAVGGEHLDSHAGVQNYTVGKLGKIVISAGSWYLPFIDLTTVATLQNIRVLSASTGSILSSGLSVDTSVIYNSIGAVGWFDNTLDLAGNMVIGSINASNVAKIHTFSTAGVGVANKTLFAGSPVNALRFSATTTGNPHYYAAAKVLTSLPSTYEWKIGRYDASLITSMEGLFSSAASNGATTTVLTSTEIVDLSIQTYPSSASSTEARLLVSSNAGTANTNLYAVRFRSTNALSCDLCVPLNYGTQELSNSKRIATTPIDLAMTIGTIGATASENVKDVLFAVYPVDSDGDSVFEPHFGIFNMSVESIQSTSTDTTGALAHRPPFIGSN